MQESKLKTIKVSVIMPVYNSEEFVADTINSVLQQDFDSFELILVDDGSTDRSGQICDSFQKSDDRVKVIHQKNGGICKARNTGLKLAVGEYIGFCDNDDKYLRGLLKDNYSLAKQYDADIVRYNRKRIINGANGRRETEVNFMPTGIHYFEADGIDKNYLMIRKCSVAVWSALYKRSFVQKHHLHFPEKAKSGLEDRIFNIKAYHSCNRIVLNSKVYYYWIRRETHSTSDKFNMNIIHTMLYCIKLERFTYEARNVENDTQGYWSNIILFYLYFGFWNINRRCCKINFFEKISVLKKIRMNCYIDKYLTGASSNDITDNNILARKIVNSFYKKKYIRTFLLLKIRNQEY